MSDNRKRSEGVSVTIYKQNDNDMKSSKSHSPVALLRGIVAVAVMAACLSTVSAQAGEHMFGPTGIYGTLDKQSIRVTRVEGPATGKVTPGTVIVVDPLISTSDKVLPSARFASNSADQRHRVISQTKPN